MVSQATWKLPERLAALSTTPWPEAKHEWELTCITMLDSDSLFGKCLCGHTPIRELCHIRNRINENETVVGNHCVKQLDSESEDESVFTTIPKICRASQRILKSTFKSANRDLIQLARKQGVFTEREVEFYSAIQGKKNKFLAKQDRREKIRLNTRLLHQLSPRAAYQSLRENLGRATVPGLINFARSKGVVTQDERSFYLQIWNRRLLNETSLMERNRINQKIIDGLRAQLGV